MVDRLKKSLEQLDPAICSTCSIEMIWSRSTLVDATTVDHVFLCPGCSHRSEFKTKVRATKIPPKMLSAPRERRAT